MDAKAWVFTQGVTRVYDGTTNATLEFKGAPTDGGDVILNGSVANFTDNKDVGIDKPIVYSGYTLTGTDAGRFDLFTPVGTAAGSGTTTGEVTKRPLTATVTAYNKPYDGNTTAIPVPTLTIDPPGTDFGLVTGETLTVTGTGTFNSPDVATANTVTLNSTTLADGTGGGLATNYSLATGQTALAIITPVDLNITARNDTKPYDAAPYSGGNGVDYSAFVNGEGPGVLGGTLGYGGNSQGAVNVGSYAITPGGQTSTNYTIQYIDGTLLVTAVPLLITANPDSKTYDGAPYIGGNGVIYDAFVGGEGPNVLSGVLSYDGTSQGAVTPGSYAISPLGFTSSNYDITYAPNTLLIRPKALIGDITAADKLYDGTTSATITGRPLSGVVGSDDVTYTGGTATFDTPTAGVDKPVTGTGLGLSGTDAGNYTVNTTAITTATITPAPLTVTANDATKTYGQTLVLAATAFTTTALVNGETVDSVTAVSPGTVATAPVAGSPYAITPSAATGGTFTPGNYSITYVDGQLYVLLVVVIPPVLEPPMLEPPLVEPPVDSPDVVVLPDTPVDLPIVKSPVAPNAWPPVVILPSIPPQLQTFTPPVLSVPVAAPIPMAAVPRSQQIEPLDQPELPRYAAPIRPRKQDRN